MTQSRILIVERFASDILAAALRGAGATSMAGSA